MLRFIIFIGFFFLGCGYHPISYYSQKILGDSVHIDLIVNLANTENSVALKDFMSKAIAARLNKQIKNKDEAQSTLLVTLANITDNSISIDRSGFTTFYRVNVTVEFNVRDRKSSEGKDFVFTAYYDYAVSLQDPTITYQNRLEAINEAAIQCIDRFIAHMAYAG